MDKPWFQGDVVIANPGYKWISKWDEGKNYVIEKFLDEQGNLVGIYCDICAPVRKTVDGYEFEDWYLDVWQPIRSKPELLDDDELSEAVKAGHLTDKEAVIARDTADNLLKELDKNIPDF